MTIIRLLLLACMESSRFLTPMETALAYYVSYCPYGTFGSSLYLLARSSDLLDILHGSLFSLSTARARLIFFHTTPSKAPAINGLATDTLGSLFIPGFSRHFSLMFAIG